MITQGGEVMADIRDSDIELPAEMLRERLGPPGAGLPAVPEPSTWRRAEFRLVRLRLEGEVPKREEHWSIEPLGRFQDNGVLPGLEYLYVIARVHDGEETPLMVTNPIRMPLRRTPYATPGELPSSIDLQHRTLRRALKEEG
jgi:hypothetical protein